MFDRLLIWFEVMVSWSSESGKDGLEFNHLTRGYQINIESTLDEPTIFPILRTPSHS
jgi:hypothetical protein